MGLITKTVKIIPRNKQISYFKNLGYIFDKGEEIEVNVSDLSPASGIEISCKCDYCNTIMNMPYKEYTRQLSGIIKKISCRKCRGEKTTESNLLVYGVRRPSELSEVKERVRNTNRSKYGKDYYTQTDEYIERVKQTNLSKYNMEWCINDPNIREKQRQTLITHYGVDAPYKSKEIQDKRTKTLMNKYGVNNPSQYEEFKEKKKQSCLKTTGYEYAIQSPEVRERIQETNIKRWGVPNAMQSSEIKQRAIETNRQKYGVDNPLQNDEIQAKARQTNLLRYGYEYTSQSPEIKAKMISTMYQNQTVKTSRQQLYIANLYNMKLNYPIVYWNVDMYDEDSKQVWEYDGGGHWLLVETGRMSIEEFNQRELVREKVIRRNGYKIARIVSKKDLLPSDTILLQMLSDAKQYFSEYPNHSWIIFDIDNGIVRNAETKDGSPYFYGELRKISKSDLKSA